MYGTVARPDGDGPFPAVVLVAGSGPTDRDWCSPLLPGTNGSGRLLAEVLADAGIASLRYDKRASGPNAVDNVTKLIGRMSMQSHLDELASAVGVLAAQDFVDATRIAALGNSEGTLHVLHYATSAQNISLAGIVLAAPPGRPVGAVLLEQLAALATQLPDGADFMPAVRAAAERYRAGQAMDLDPDLPDPVKSALAAFESPANLPFARELWAEDATTSLSRVEIPTLVLIGGRDRQIDVRADGGPLQAAAAGMTNVVFAFPPNANHVFKEDTRSSADVRAAPDGDYNQPGGRLDPESVATILDWLRSVLA